VLGDIHGNLEAFRAVLDDLERSGGFDEMLCLGDVVGYCPDPHECIRLLRQSRHVCVAGNHDRAAIGEIDTSDFNPHAAAAVQWTARHLAAEDVEYLRSLPLTLSHGLFTLAHGSPRDPIWEYLLSARAALDNLSHFETHHCFVGHSHVPLIFRCGGQGAAGCTLEDFLPGKEVKLSGGRLIINPGAVGQPRDGDPRASYAVVDTEAGTVRLHRVSYDVLLTQDKMTREGLPAYLSFRLAYGR
jgi:diadenosine tetraphosphatase ApaH/serine/threonine PP2A family protein phosphatase